MKTKIFKIRLTEEFIYADQNALDRFLQENNILKYETAFVKEEENYWSVILYYEELKVHFNEAQPEKYSAEQELSLIHISFINFSSTFISGTMILICPSAINFPVKTSGSLR